MSEDRLWQIDADSQIITVSHGHIKKHFRNQWFEFFCCLIANDSRTFTNAEAIQRLPSWRRKSRPSVGKEISRAIDEWAKGGLALVSYQNKTEGWRLDEHAKCLTDANDRMIASGVLRALEFGSWSQFHSVPDREVAEWFTGSIRVMLALTGGRIAEAAEQLVAAGESTASNELWAINGVLNTKIGQRLTKPKLPVLHSSFSNMSLFEIAVEARQLAAYAVRSSTEEWDRYLALLHAVMPRLLATGDTTSQAVVLNAMGVLACRLGMLEGALTYLKGAAPLAAFSGDLMLVQSVAFNFGNVLSEIDRKQGFTGDRAHYIALLELDRAMRKQFQLGNDSAQTELLLGHLSYEFGEFENALAYLAESERIIEISNAPLDRALHCRLEAVVKAALFPAVDPHTNDVIADLDQAIALYEGVGKRTSAEYARSERQRILDAYQG